MPVTTPMTHETLVVLFLTLLAWVQYCTADTPTPGTRNTVILTTATFDEATRGQKAFVAFKAPWCGHCKKLKPEWDQLAQDVDILVAEVDCTVEKTLCADQGVQGYPTIKWSDGYGWNKYTQARDYQALVAFVEEHMAHGCFDDETQCTVEEQQALDDARQLTPEDRATRLDALKQEKADAEKVFHDAVEKLQAQYQTVQDTRQKTLDRAAKEESVLQYVQTHPQPPTPATTDL